MEGKHVFYYFFRSEGPMILSLALIDWLEQLTEFKKNSLLIIKDIIQEQPRRYGGRGIELSLWAPHPSAPPLVHNPGSSLNPIRWGLLWSHHCMGIIDQVIGHSGLNSISSP